MFVSVAWNIDQVWLSGEDLFRQHFSPEELVNILLHPHQLNEGL